MRYICICGAEIYDPDLTVEDDYQKCPICNRKVNLKTREASKVKENKK